MWWFLVALLLAAIVASYWSGGQGLERSVWQAFDSSVHMLRSQGGVDTPRSWARHRTKRRAAACAGEPTADHRETAHNRKHGYYTKEAHDADDEALSREVWLQMRPLRRTVF